LKESRCTLGRTFLARKLDYGLVAVLAPWKVHFPSST
jgi:hypothetical protein